MRLNKFGVSEVRAPIVLKTSAKWWVRKNSAKACAKTSWQVHAFCLMPLHLVVETPQANLVAGLERLLAKESDASPAIEKGVMKC